MLRKLGRIRPSPPNDDGDVPRGQFVTEKFPVLTFGGTPEIDMETWRLRIFGLVEQELTLDWGQLQDLDQTSVDAVFHCVTQWSRMENTWEGVSFARVAGLARPLTEAKFAMVHCYGGYSTNLPLDVLLDDDVLLANRHDGAPLAPEHGGPLRLVVPKRYGWKSAKWVNGIELTAEDAPGFWESRGYHMEGDPWKEQRFWDSLS